MSHNCPSLAKSSTFGVNCLCDCSAASQIAQENDLYASVMIAQAVLESGNGSSVLAQAPYYN
ncbi:glucosaminidase domain-containing protein, partial [Enterococcus sp. S86.2]|uniref:glucosaminidase domain-containing protein n=1 Tax=Enterococcus sp. S86.2 TaxID=3031299 RepID=UPI0034E8CE7B